jgi:hypothetical protein
MKETSDLGRSLSEELREFYAKVESEWNAHAALLHAWWPEAPARGCVEAFRPYELALFTATHN